MDGIESHGDSARTAVLHAKHAWLLTVHDGAKRWYHCRECDYSGDRLYHARMHHERIHVNQGKAVLLKRKNPSADDDEEKLACEPVKKAALTAETVKKEVLAPETRNTNAEVELLLKIVAREMGVESMTVEDVRKLLQRPMAPQEEPSKQDEPADDATSCAAAVLLGAASSAAAAGRAQRDVPKRGRYQRAVLLSEAEVLEIFLQRPKMKMNTGRMVRGGMIEAKAIAVEYGATVKTICEIWRGLRDQAFP